MYGDADPTARYLRFQAAVKALQEGHDPSNEWVQRAPLIGGGFSLFQPVYRPAGPARLIAAYRDFLIRQLGSFRVDVDKGVLAHSTYYMIPSLLFPAGDPGAPVMEALLDEVERAVPDTLAVRYLRGRYYLYWSGSEEQPNPVMRQKARATLLGVANAAPGRYPRLARAWLAARLFTEGDYALARTHFLAYLERYPEGDWAWVAALRAGQCSERLNERRRAVDEYHDAAVRFASNPLARVLGLTHAARVNESRGRRTRALADYRAARAAWSDEYGRAYTIGISYSNHDPLRVTPRLLERRIDALSRARE